MILGIDQGIGGCVLDMEKKMGWVPRLETAENTEFLKSVQFLVDFFERPKWPENHVFQSPQVPGPVPTSLP